MSKFKKQHYIIVAGILAECSERAGLDEPPQVIIDWIAEEFRAIFAADNSNFDDEKFIEACDRLTS